MAVGGGLVTRLAIHGQRFDEALEVGNFGAEMLELRSELNSTYRRSGQGNLHYFVSKFSEVLKADSIRSGGQHHPHTAGKTL